MPSEPYSILAAGYEAVMEHVDYVAWARYVRRLLERHHPTAVDILELGCGTGSLARELQPLGPDPNGYRYRASDVSSAMLSEARKASSGMPISFEQVDFRDVPPDPKADAVLLLYDGLNYLLDATDVRRLFESVAGSLGPGGVFIFDQSTPANSRRPEWDDEDAGATPAYDYRRTSTYDRRGRLHHTTFRFTFPDGREEVEEHVQRAYTFAEVDALLRESPLEPLGAYDGFTLRPANRRRSERIHWVARESGNRVTG